MSKLKTEITKPYRVSLVVDNKPLITKSSTVMAHVHQLNKPLYSGYKISERNPFWVTGCGFTEFMIMKLIRKEYAPAQVLEIKEVDTSHQ